MGDMGPSEFARLCNVSPASVTFWLAGATKALKAEPVAHMEAKLGYRASWIVLGKGPKKIDDHSPPWPMSPEVRQKVLRLKEEELHRLEAVVRSHLGMAQQISTFASERPIDTVDDGDTVEMKIDSLTTPERSKNGPSRSSKADAPRERQARRPAPPRKSR